MLNYQTAIYDVSNPCNYRCVYCRNNWSDESNTKHEKLENIKIKLRNISNEGFKRIIFTGGEFFVIPYWKEILKYSESLGLEKWIITNLSIIDEEDLDFLQKYVSRINVSFHADNSKLYNEIMNPPKKNSFHKVLKNMKYINKKNIPLGIFFSPIKLNYKKLFKTIKKIQNKGIKITDVNVNRIVMVESTKQYMKDEKILNHHDHKRIVQQAIKINEELDIKTYLEAYPLCFLKSIKKDKLNTLSKPCFVGRKAIAINSDGTYKLCPASNYHIDEINNLEVKDFKSQNWRNEKCLKCEKWVECLGGCHAATGEIYSDDPLMIKDEVKLQKGIDKKFFNLLNKIYKPFLSSSYINEQIKYTAFSEKYDYPIGFIAIKKTKSGGNFIEIALIPKMQKNNYAFLLINELLKNHNLKKIDWTSHKSNYPSIKLLKKLNGGVFESTVLNKKRIEVEGFFRANSDATKKMMKSLNKIIPESKKKFEIWLKKYEERVELLKELEKYLREYQNENN